MRAAAIFGLGTSPKSLEPFREHSATEWIEGVPASSSEADAVLIFGGDGTIHRHLPALVRLGLPVLIVPAGSGNDFARALQLWSARDSLRVWRAFESGKLRAQHIDLGTITPTVAPEGPRYFCCVAGCGLDSAAAERANRMPRWLRGHGGYVLALLPALLNFPAFSLTLTFLSAEADVRTTKPTVLAAFANTQFYGGGMRVAPLAKLADGKLDVCCVRTLSTIKLILMFPTVYVGRHLRMREVEYSKAERVRVETDKPTAIYADGEFVCETPVEIGVEAGVLRVIAPGLKG